LREIVGEEPVVFGASPYVRTRETLNAVAAAWGGLDQVKWFEDPRLREQDFGNFQDIEKVQQAKLEKEKFGPFYYRMPSGESPADVYDRISSFFETMHRTWDRRERTDETNEVLVIHGMTISVFLMRLFKYSVDEFHAYCNFENAEFCVLERQATGRYSKSLMYCVKQIETPDGWFSKRGPRSERTDKGRFDRAINTEPPSMGRPAALERKQSVAGTTFVTKTYQPNIGTGFRCDEMLRVEAVIEASQSDDLGIMPGWYLVAMNGEVVENGGAREAVRNAKRTGKPYEVRFRIPLDALGSPAQAGTGRL